MQWLSSDEESDNYNLHPRSYTANDLESLNVSGMDDTPKDKQYINQKTHFKKFILWIN